MPAWSRQDTARPDVAAITRYFRWQADRLDVEVVVGQWDYK